MLTLGSQIPENSVFQQRAICAATRAVRSAFSADFIAVFTRSANLFANLKIFKCGISAFYTYETAENSRCLCKIRARGSMELDEPG